MDGKKSLAQQYDFNQLNAVVKQYLKHQIDMETQAGGVNCPAAQGFQRVLETFEKEEKQKQGANIVSKYSEFQLNKVPKKREDLVKFPLMYQAYVNEQDYERALTQSKHNPQPHDQTKIDIEPPLNDKEKKLSYQYSILQRQHGSVLQSARQIFSIAINCLQQLHNIKDGNVIADPASLAETIENYKIQLDKYDQILSSEGRADRSKLFSEAVMTEHKNKLIQAKQQGNVKGVIEVLLSLRVNALQISPELRKNLIYELVRNDVFLLQSSVSDTFLIDLLSINQPAMQHAILSLISVIASTLKGVEYLMTNGKKILITLINIMKDLSKQRPQTTNPVANSVNTRFCIAIMQKMSIKSQLSPIFIENGVIDFILDRLEDHYKSSSQKINTRTKQPEGQQHVFFLDFSTALLANILHSKITQDWLVKNPKQLISISNRLLNSMMQPKIPTSTLIHILIALSYLNKTEALRGVVETPAVHFSDKISCFVEMFSKQPLNEKNMEDRNIQRVPGPEEGAQQLDDENGDIDKRTILDLCAYMFHPNRTGAQAEKENNNLDDSDEQFIQSYEVGEFNDMRTDDRIKEFENEQGDLIFECFQDEEHMFQ